MNELTDEERAKWADLDRLDENLEEMLRENRAHVEQQRAAEEERERNRQPEIRIPVGTLLLWIFWIIPAIVFLAIILRLIILGIT